MEKLTALKNPLQRLRSYVDNKRTNEGWSIGKLITILAEVAAFLTINEMRIDHQMNIRPEIIVYRASA